MDGGRIGGTIERTLKAAGRVSGAALGFLATHFAGYPSGDYLLAHPGVPLSHQSRLDCLVARRGTHEVARLTGEPVSFTSTRHAQGCGVTTPADCCAGSSAACRLRASQRRLVSLARGRGE